MIPTINKYVGRTVGSTNHQQRRDQTKLQESAQQALAAGEVTQAFGPLLLHYDEQKTMPLASALLGPTNLGCDSVLFVQTKRRSALPIPNLLQSKLRKQSETVMFKDIIARCRLDLSILKGIDLSAALESYPNALQNRPLKPTRNETEPGELSRKEPALASQKSNTLLTPAALQKLNTLVKPAALDELVQIADEELLMQVESDLQSSIQPLTARDRTQANWVNLYCTDAVMTSL